MTMENTANKETFKLLQISDDSRSISDLDLPELPPQRKRKVRRKTRQRSTSINRHEDNLKSIDQCNRLIVWIAIFLTCCWLLTLSYMIGVIHSENLRLEIQIKKLSVTSQNLPEALQKWHETSKNLEQNQTIIYSKILELQYKLENLTNDLIYYKEKLSQKTDYKNDEKLVANFGAKIVAVTDDVHDIKEKFSQFQNEQIKVKDNIQEIKSNLSEALNKVSLSTNNSSRNYSIELKDIQNSFLNRINTLTTDMSVLNNTLSQKTEGYDKELHTHNQRLDNLTETNANISSRVESIEDSWTEYKNKTMGFEFYKDKMNKEISNLKNSTITMNNVLQELRTDCNKYERFFKDLKEKEVINKPNEAEIVKINNNETIKNELKLENNERKSEPAIEEENLQRITNVTENSVSNKTTTEESFVVGGKPKLLSIQN